MNGVNRLPVSQSNAMGPRFSSESSPVPCTSETRQSPKHSRSSPYNNQFDSRRITRENDMDYRPRDCSRCWPCAAPAPFRMPRRATPPLKFGITAVILPGPERVPGAVGDPPGGAPRPRRGVRATRQLRRNQASCCRGTRIDIAWVCGAPYVRHRDRWRLVAVPAGRRQADLSVLPHRAGVGFAPPRPTPISREPCSPIPTRTRTRGTWCRSSRC